MRYRNLTRFLAMMLVCLPVQARAEEQRASLMPKKFEQLETITTLEEGVITFTESSELASLCAQAQNNPSKNYVCIYTGYMTIHIRENLTIPENMAFGVVYNGDLGTVIIEPGVTVELYGQLEVNALTNKAVINIHPTGILYAYERLHPDGGYDWEDTHINNDGTIISGGLYSVRSGEEDPVRYGENGIYIYQTTVSNESRFEDFIETAEERKNGHVFFYVELTGSGIEFDYDQGIMVIPSNCSLFINEPFYLKNAELNVYGYMESASQLTIDGSLRIMPGGGFGVGGTVSVNGVLENYGEIAIVSNIDGYNGSLVQAKPHKYVDGSVLGRGQIAVVAPAGAEYPTQAIAGVDVNNFNVEWTQEDGKSCWILRDFKYVSTPIGGTFDNKFTWKLEGKTLILSGEGVIENFGNTYQPPYAYRWQPWYAYKDLIEKAVIEEGITDFRNALIDLCEMTEVQIAESVTKLNGSCFENCYSLEFVLIPAGLKELESTAFNDSGVKTVCFAGDAPEFGVYKFLDDTVTTAMYPANNETWTEVVESSPNAVNWVPYTCNHSFETVIVEPDCLNPGAYIRTCTICDEVVTEPSGEPPQGHNYGVDDNGNPDFWDTTCDVCGAERKVDKHRPTHSMYRMYNPNSGEHFYTGSMEERKVLEAAGWKYEGVGFTFPATTGKPVYRLYDKDNTMEHLYTMDEAEKDMLLAQGWVLEGVAFNSGREDEVPQYRLHNPNATIGAYHFTASREEKDALIAAGWEYQGIGFYTCLQ